MRTSDRTNRLIHRATDVGMFILACVIAVAMGPGWMNELASLIVGSPMQITLP